MDATRTETVISIINKTYTEMETDLNAVGNKSNATTLSIIHSPIIEIKVTVLNDFKNLVDLNLSKCIICRFEHGVFDNLKRLKSINLSNNVISLIEDKLFEENRQLETIILKNNLLDSFSKMAFSHSKHLDTLDLSYNHIFVVKKYCLNCAQLKKFYLNNNQIRHVMRSAFYHIPNLMCLALDNNQIDYLEWEIFDNSKNLRHLSLNNNQITQLDDHMFHELPQLTKLFLKNNLLAQKIDGVLFFLNSKLTDLDLSDNRITNIEKLTFANCINLKTLHLKVTGKFTVMSIDHLKSLSKFELYYEPRETFSLRRSFWIKLLNKDQLTVLKLIIQKIELISLCNFAPLKNLEYLHIECLQPNNTVKDIHFYTCFNSLLKLTKLVLKRLNSYTISKSTVKVQRLSHLEVVGFRNSVINYMFNQFVSLVYLNLSFSGFKFITKTAFELLINLEHLKFEYSQLRMIQQHLFKNNVKLKIINGSNCHIRFIADFSFQNLEKLVLLDLRHNLFHNASGNVFFGLNRATCRIRL